MFTKIELHRFQKRDATLLVSSHSTKHLSRWQFWSEGLSVSRFTGHLYHQN